MKRLTQLGKAVLELRRVPGTHDIAGCRRLRGRRPEQAPRGTRPSAAFQASGGLDALS